MMVPSGIYPSRYAKDGRRKSFASLTTVRVQVKESIYRDHAKHDVAKHDVAKQLSFVHSMSAGNTSDPTSAIGAAAWSLQLLY